MESILAAFPRILEQLDNNPDAREAFVLAAWRKSVGDLLNEHTVPVALAGDRLRVAVASRTWQRHLELMAAEVLAKLNASTGRITITFIEFFIDDAVVAANRPSVKAGDLGQDMTRGDKTDPALQLSASRIHDEALKKAFLLAAQSCLDRKMRRTNI